jgi:hypothetical protein
MIAILPAPAYVLARAACIPTLMLCHADGRFTRLEGDPCEENAAALVASWRLRLAVIGPQACATSPRSTG